MRSLEQYQTIFRLRAHIRAGHTRYLDLVYTDCPPIEIPTENLVAAISVYADALEEYEYPNQAGYARFILSLLEERTYLRSRRDAWLRHVAFENHGEDWLWPVDEPTERSNRFLVGYS